MTGAVPTPGVSAVIRDIRYGGRFPPTNGDPPTKFYHMLFDGLRGRAV
jgi:hypothetical protein